MTSIKKLFDFRVDFDSDWFVHLISEQNQLELGIIDQNNALVPAEYQTAPKGFYITFVVENVDTIHEAANAAKLEVL